MWSIILENYGPNSEREKNSNLVEEEVTNKEE